MFVVRFANISLVRYLMNPRVIAWLPALKGALEPRLLTEILLFWATLTDVNSNGTLQTTYPGQKRNWQTSNRWILLIVQRSKLTNEDDKLCMTVFQPIPLRLNYRLTSTIRYLQKLFIHQKKNSCMPCVPMFEQRTSFTLSMLLTFCSNWGLYHKTLPKKFRTSKKSSAAYYLVTFFAFPCPSVVLSFHEKWNL